ncbi:hypothetical protein N0V82_008294 [Gnomoniopsis sp. IMI 355080]|nr:hypothetical protein N0V82_008294 [Gnomoniopsis sp. IMI 355080]
MSRSPLFTHHLHGDSGDEMDATEDITSSEVNGQVNGQTNGQTADETLLDPKDVGMAVGYKHLYSGEEDRKGRFIWQTEVPKDLGKPAEDAESERWAIIVRRVRVYNDPKKVLALHSIAIQSPYLKDILKDVLRGYPGVTASLKRLEFSGRCEPLLHRWPALRETIVGLEKQSDEGDEEAGDRARHARLLDDLLSREFSEVEEAMADMKKNGVITFQHMWTLYAPNILIFSRQDNQDRALRLQTSRYSRDRSGQPIFCLTGVYVDFDGQRFGTQKINISISIFEGTKPISNLAAFPIDLHEEYEQIKTKLIERGARVEALAGSHFRSYNGVGWRIGPYGNKEKHTVKGRVVIDPFGYNRFEPDFAVYVSPLNVPDVSAHPGTATGVGVPAMGRPRDGRGRPPPPRFIDPMGMPSTIDPICSLDDPDMDDGGMPADGFFDDEDSMPKRPALTDEQRLMCTPLVRGYALKEKKWLNFFVNAITDIPFNELAFSSLNLPKNQKDLILGFTSVKAPYRNQFDDVIEGKGKGIIILLSGPPGVGKTLTAESVAEQMKVPLYIMAAGDLGLDPRSVENNLRDAMSMCSRWGAILLLDEADIFLEERSLHELERNKLVSIFLRVLEYYEGIMFLTTNRVQTFDAAFQSRIHISLEYPELDMPARKAIWQNFLERHNMAQAAARDKSVISVTGAAKSQPTKKRIASSPTPGTEGNTSDQVDEEDSTRNARDEELHQRLLVPHNISPYEITHLAALKINGRQIKNFLKTAQLLAIYKEEPLCYSHLDTVINSTQHLHKATEATDHARGAIYH